MCVSSPGPRGSSVLLFPLTVRGLLILALAAGLLAAGIARADLAGLFWGSSFLLVTIYALAAGHLLRLLRPPAENGGEHHVPPSRRRA